MRGKNRRNPSAWLYENDIFRDRRVVEPNASLPPYEQEGSQFSTATRVKSPLLSLPCLVDFAVEVDNESLGLLATGKILPARLVKLNSRKLNGCSFPWRHERLSLRQVPLTVSLQIIPME
jgi:hypothetical protein